jgi:hypothetical protein
MSRTIITKAVIHYRKPYPTSHGRPKKMSVIRTDQGVEDAIRLADPYVKFDHVSSVVITQGSRAILHLK